MENDKERNLQGREMQRKCVQPSLSFGVGAEPRNATAVKGDFL